MERWNENFFSSSQRSIRNVQKYIKAGEQRWDILAQHVHFETVINILNKRLRTTLLRIIQKINMKLSGLNYKTDSTILDQETLVLGFATSQKPSGFDDTNLVSVGFAFNSQDDTHKFIINPNKLNMYV